MIRATLIFLFFVKAVTAQVPNNGFETWVNGNPDLWQTANIPIVEHSVIPDSDAYSGFLSAKGIVVANSHNNPYPPYLGMEGPGALGFSVTQRNALLSGWFKLYLNPGDRLIANAKIYNSIQEPIAEGRINIDQSVSAWTLFNIHLDYFSQDSAVTCSVFFTITDSTGLSSGQIGSYFLIDELAISGVDGISPVFMNNNISVFPNPAHYSVHLRTSNAVNSFYALNDITGKALTEKQINTDDELISLEGYAPGIYFLRIFSDEKNYTKKIVVE